MLLGIDIGTSGSKAILMDRDGVVRASHREEYGITTRFPGWAEQDPEMWVDRVAACVKRVAAAAPGRVRGIAFSGQMHGIVLVDDAGRCLQDAVIWADSRSGREVEEVLEIVGEERFRGVTLNRLAAGYGLASLYWLRKNEPGILEKTFAVLCPKDYVRARLTGSPGQETSDASATCCLDVRRGDWAWDILGDLGLPARCFPKIGRSVDQAGTLDAEGARLCGLPEGTPVYFGGADSSMAGIGAGVVEEGLLGLNIGTGGQVSTILKEPRFDSGYRTSTFCHPIPGHWMLQGSTLCAGLALKWFREAFCPERTFAELSEMAATVRPGAEGLLFLPYLTGERTPWFDPDVRGVFSGLSLKHGMPHMVRAIMEGVVMALEQSFALLREAGVNGTRVISMGGGAQSPVWLRIQSDVFGLPVEPAVGGDACIGAAITAGVGCGAYADYREGCLAAVRRGGKTYEPNAGAHAVYCERKGVFKELYLANRAISRSIK